MNGLVDACGFLVFHGAWQAAVVAALILIAVRLGRRWPAPVRYALLLVALAKFAMPPILALPSGVFSHWGPEFGWIERKTSQPPALATDGPTPSFESAPIDRQIFDPAWASTSPSAVMSKAPMVPLPAAVALWDWKLSLLLMHIVGAAAVFGWLAVQWINLRKVKASAVKASDGQIIQRLHYLRQKLGLRRSVQLLVAREGTVPCSVGLFRAVVIVPESLVSQPSDDLDRVLAHELAHHRRGDLWVNAAGLALLAVWWFHPLYWLLRRALRAVREDCCDDLLLAAGIAAPAQYCQTILRVASSGARSALAPIAATMADYPHPLEKRFRRIMDGSLKRCVRLGWLGLAAVVALAAVVLPGARGAGQAGETAVEEAQSTAKSLQAAGGDQPSRPVRSGNPGTAPGSSKDEDWIGYWMTGNEQRERLRLLAAENEDPYRLGERSDLFALPPKSTDSGYRIYPELTPLQRLYVYARSPDTSPVLVLVNGAALANPEASAEPAADLERLESELKALADAPGTIRFLVRYGATHPPRARVLEIQASLSRVGKAAGFTDHKVYGQYSNDMDKEMSDWQRASAILGKDQEQGPRPSEEPIGNEFLRVYPVRAPLSRLLTDDSDCVVQITHPLDSPAHDFDVSAFQEDLGRFVTDLQLPRRNRISFLVTFEKEPPEPDARGRLLDALQVAAESLGFEFVGLRF